MLEISGRPKSVALGVPIGNHATPLGSGEPEPDRSTERTHSAAVTNALIEAFNERNGTDVRPGITGLPFKK
jgi:hypothetical protein